MVKNYRPGGVGMLEAAPGTFLLHAYFDDNQVELVRSAVLGWQIGADRKITPLVLDPRAADDEPYTVNYPDGRVETSDGRTWDDLGSFIDEEKRRQREAA